MSDPKQAIVAQSDPHPLDHQTDQSALASPPGGGAKPWLTVPAMAAALGGRWGIKHARSPIVRAWGPSAHESEQVGPLSVKAFGAGSSMVVILHGLGATGDYFGAHYDQLGQRHQVKVPDLLGFGRSLDEQRSSFTIEDHLDALDASLLGDTRPDEIVILAHSMGSALAMAWAQRRRGLVRAVVCAGAPIYADESEARAAITETNPMARLLLLDETWAHRACAFSCKHRTAAGWLAATVEPSMPVPISRFASLHTWPAYQQSVDQLILRADWKGLMGALAQNQTPLTLLWGEDDRIGDREFAKALTADGTQVTVTVPGADHHLPITHPETILRTVAASW